MSVSVCVCVCARASVCAYCALCEAFFQFSFTSGLEGSIETDVYFVATAGATY